MLAPYSAYQLRQFFKPKGGLAAFTRHLTTPRHYLMSGKPDSHVPKLQLLFLVGGPTPLDFADSYEAVAPF
jgi:hypothetical protein